MPVGKKKNKRRRKWFFSVPLGVRATSQDALPQPDVPRTDLPALRGAGASAEQGSTTTTCGIGILNTLAPTNRIMQRDDAAKNYEVLPVQMQATGQGLGHHLCEQTNLFLNRLGDLSGWWRSAFTINYLSNDKPPVVTRHYGVDEWEARSTRTALFRECGLQEHGLGQGGMLREHSRTSTCSSESTRLSTAGEGATTSSGSLRQQERAPDSTCSNTTWTRKNGN